MLIVKSQRFDEELEDIIDFIAQDNLYQALKFYDGLVEKIHDIPLFPKKHKKSSKSFDVNIRELVYKKYVIPYKIYDDKILILGIFNQNLWNM